MQSVFQLFHVFRIFRDVENRRGWIGHLHRESYRFPSKSHNTQTSLSISLSLHLLQFRWFIDTSGIAGIGLSSIVLDGDVDHCSIIVLDGQRDVQRSLFPEMNRTKEHLAMQFLRIQEHLQVMITKANATDGEQDRLENTVDTGEHQSGTTLLRQGRLPESRQLRNSEHIAGVSPQPFAEPESSHVSRRRERETCGLTGSNDFRSIDRCERDFDRVPSV